MRRLLTALLVLTPLLSGCGASATNNVKAVRATLATMAQAMSTKDYTTLCDEVFAPSLLAPASRLGISCEQALRTGFSKTENAVMLVQGVSVKGNSATARVYTSAANQKPLVTTLALQKISGHWYVAQFAQ